MEDRLPCTLNQKEAAAYMKMSIPTFTKLVKAGEIPKPWRWGKRMIRYSRVALEKWADSNIGKE